MLQVLQYVITTLKNDATLQTYLGTSPTRVFPQGVDTSPENMPCITVFNVSEVTHTNPRSEREGMIQVDIWVNKGTASLSPQLLSETIYERVLTLMNFDQYQSGYGNSLLRWSREDFMLDQFESDRRIYHKVIRWKWWARPQS